MLGAQRHADCGHRHNLNSPHDNSNAAVRLTTKRITGICGGLPSSVTVLRLKEALRAYSRSALKPRGASFVTRLTRRPTGTQRQAPLTSNARAYGHF